MIKLYRASSTLSKFPHRGLIYDKVQFEWLMDNRKEPLVPYEQAIVNYRKDKDEWHLYPEEYINELFTEDEAKALKDYLLRAENANCEIREQKLPIPFKTMSVSAISAGGDNDFLMLFMDKEYDLPFPVLGYFDVTDKKPSGKYKDRTDYGKTNIHENPDGTVTVEFEDIKKHLINKGLYK